MVSFFSKLFGSKGTSDKPAAIVGGEETEGYNDLTLVAVPMKEGGQHGASLFSDGVQSRTV